MKTAVRQFRDKAISVLTAFALLISVFSAFSLNFRASAEEYVQMEIEDYHLWYKSQDKKDSDFVDVAETEDVLTVRDGDLVKFYLKWLIPNNLDNYNLQTEINTHGIDFTVPAEGILYYEGEPIGEYKVFSDDTSGIDRKTYFQATLYEDKVKDKSNISGGLIIDGKVSFDEDGTVKNGSEQQLGYGDKDVTVIYDDGTSNGNVTISKLGGSLSDDGSGNFITTYNIKVTIKGFINTVTVRDSLPEGFTKVDGSLSVTCGEESVPFTDNSTGTSLGEIKLSQVAGAGKNTSTTYNIQYSAKISKEDLMQMYVNLKRNILNTAYVDFIDENGNPTTKQSTAPTDVSEPSVSKTVNTTKTSNFNNIIQVNYNGMQKYCRLIEYTIEIKTGYLGELSEEDLKTVIKSLKDNFYNLNDTMWIPYSNKGRYYNSGTYYSYSLNQAPTYFSELIFEHKGDLSGITDDEFNTLIHDYGFSYENGTYTINYKIIILDDELNKKGLQNYRSFTNVVQADIEGKHFVVPVTLSELPGINVLDKTLGVPNGSTGSTEERGPYHNWDLNTYGFSGSLNSFKIDNSSGTPTLWIPWEITVNSDDLKLAYSKNGKVTLSDILGYVFYAGNDTTNNEYIPGRDPEPATHYFDTEDFWDYFTIDGGHYSKQSIDTVTENRWSIDFTNQVRSIVNNPNNSHDYKIRYYSKLKLQDNGDGTYSIPSEFINKNLYNTSTIQEEDEPVYNDNYTLKFTSPLSTTKEPDTVHLTKGNISKSSKTISFAGDKITFTDGLSIGWRLGVPVSDITSKREHEDGSVSADILTFVDDLPEGLKFDKDSLIAVYWDGSYYSTSTSKTLKECKLDSSSYTVTYDETERTITIKFTVPEDFETKVKDLSAQRIEIFFKTDVDKEWLSENSDKSSYSFRNDAKVVLNGDITDSDYTSFSMNFPKVADKSGVIVDNIDENEIVKDMRMKAEYTLTINPLALDLNKKSNALTIRDTMNAHLILLPETVQFIDGNTGEVLKGAGYSFSYYPVEGNTVVFNIPDGAYVKIVYDTIIDVDPGENPNWLKETDNAFTIDDVDLSNANDHTVITTFNGRVQAYVRNETGSITISKYFVDDDGEHDLAGAEFMLYSVYDNFGKVSEEEMFTEPVIIPESGSIVINNLPLDRIYWLKEVSAPEGFLVDEIGTYFKLKGDSNVSDPRDVINPNADTKALAEKITAALGNADIPEYEGNVASNVQKFLNIKEVTISGTKTWVGDSGYAVRPDDITLVLFANEKAYEGTYKPEWTKDGDEWTFTISGLPERDKEGNVINYTLEEVEVPFYESETTVDSDGNINITNTFVADKVTVQGTKTWVNDNENVRPDNITLVLKADGVEVKGAVPTWTKSGDKWTYKFENLDKYTYTKEGGVVSRKPIEYTVTENDVPLGYTAVVDKVSETEINITNTFVSDKVTVQGTKTWVNDNEDVRPDNITLILKADGVEIGAVPTWTKSGDTWTYKFENLDKYTYTKEGGVVSRKAIEYTVTEIVPVGYTAEYERSEDAEGNTIVDITNTATVTEITKVDDQNNPLAGAELVVTDKEGNPVDSWTSTTGAHTILGLIPGETYTITEKKAPASYAISKPQTFTVKGDGTVTVVTFGNVLTVTEVTKTDETGKPLAGAHLVVTDKNGAKVDEWDSETSAHQITGLVAGETYTLTETAAPAGYSKTKPITFTVNADGSLTEVTLSNALTVTQISKTDDEGTPLAGAHLMVKDKDGNIIYEWDSTKDAFTITGLTAGEKYTLIEVSAPEGYEIAPSIDFVVRVNGDITVVVMEDSLKKDSSPDTGVSGGAAVLAVLSGAAVVILSKKKRK